MSKFNTYCMVVTKTYFKSMACIDSTLGTKTYDHISLERVPCQTIDEILKSNTLLPNTKHSKLNDRLCASLLDKNYSGSYRPEGILFQTSQEPDYCSPVDIMALTTGDSFTSSDYGSEFIEKSEKLVFKSVNKMLKYDPLTALDDLNELRKQVGLKSIEKPFGYNECCFEDSVDIKPVGLVGSSSSIIENSRKYDLPVYSSTESYVSNVDEK